MIRDRFGIALVEIECDDGTVWVPVDQAPLVKEVRPDPNCPLCYGDGWIVGPRDEPGWDEEVCECVVKAQRHERGLAHEQWCKENRNG